MYWNNINIILWILFPICIAAQSADHPVDFELMKSAEITNFEAINSEYDEFSPMLYNDGIIYVASEPRNKKSKKKNKQFVFNLKYYDFVKQTDAKDFYEKDINDLHHFGPCAFNPHAKEIFFSENYKDQKGSDGRYHMKLIRAVYKDDGWVTIDDFPFNSHEYSIFHPAISADGNTLIFASNMPGGYGKMDLYTIVKNENGWSLPVNLGPEINSESNDWFPTFFENEYVFYSSDSKEGFGGLDIFVCKYLDGEWQFPQNLGDPVNSNADDIGFTISPDASYGYFSSNRGLGKGGDDIYKFQLSKPMDFEDLSTENGVEQLAPVVEVIEKEEFQFLILDGASNTAIKEANISFIPMMSDEEMSDPNYKNKFLHNDESTGKLKWLSTPNPNAISEKYSLTTDRSGKVNTKLLIDQVYALEISVEGYDNEQSILNVESLKDQSAIFISMNKTKPAVIKNSPTPTSPIPIVEEETTFKVPTIIGELLVFENLLYDYNESTIKKGGNTELKQLADYMKKYPQLEVELSAHTDAIGSAPYNLNLSQKRADVAKQFLVDQGISAYRIVAKGYGERVVRNHCVEGVICTDDEHAYNRRTELKITKN